MDRISLLSLFSVYEWSFAKRLQPQGDGFWIFFFILLILERTKDFLWFHSTFKKEVEEFLKVTKEKYYSEIKLYHMLLWRTSKEK